MINSINHHKSACAFLISPLLLFTANSNVSLSPLPPTIFSPIDLTLPYQCTLASADAAPVAKIALDVTYQSTNSKYNLENYGGGIVPFAYEVEATVSALIGTKTALLMEGYTGISGTLETEIFTSPNVSQPLSLIVAPQPLVASDEASFDFSAEGKSGVFELFGGPGYNDDLAPSFAETMTLVINTEGADVSKAPFWTADCQRSDPPATALDFRPTPVTVPTVIVGTNSDAYFKVENNTLRAIEILDIQMAGPDLVQFAPDTLSSARCLRYMGPGETCGLWVYYRPDTIGDHTANITFTTDIGSQVLQLKGSTIEYAPPSIELSSTLIDFGLVEVGSSATQTVTITNTGPATVTLPALGAKDIYRDGGIEVRRGSICRSLRPGRSCDYFIIKYTPTELESAALELSVTANYDENYVEINPDAMSVTRALQIKATSDPAAACTEQTTSYDFSGELLFPASEIRAPLSGSLTYQQSCNTDQPAVELTLNQTEFGIPLFSFLSDQLLTYTTLQFTPLSTSVPFSDADSATIAFEVIAPRIYMDLFGLAIPLSRNSECKMAEVINLTLAGMPTDGKLYTGQLPLSALSNCQFSASRINAVFEASTPTFNFQVEAR